MTKKTASREVGPEHVVEIGEFGGLDFTALHDAVAPLVDYPDDTTRSLHGMADSYVAVQKLRIGETDRGILDATIPEAAYLASLKAIEDGIGEKLTQLLRRHRLWGWLKQFPGLGGVHVAQVIGRMKNPRRTCGMPFQ